MEKIKITALQFCAKLGDKQSNFSKVKELLTELKDSDILVLPEVWNIGWDTEIFKENAEDFDGETIRFLSELAKENKCNIIGGSLITKRNGYCYNTCPVFDRHGNLVTIYDKNHLYSYYGSNESKYVTAGDSPVMVNLEGINIGLTICYDIRFPEIYRAYRKAGADIMVNCAAWASTKPIPWEMMTKSRAIENQTFMIAVNQYGLMKDNETNLGHSRIIDYNGNVLSEILEGEGLISAELDFKDMYIFRDKCTILNDIKKSYEVVTCEK